MHCDSNCYFRVYKVLFIPPPRAGSGVVRIDPLRFLTGCRKRRLNQAPFFPLNTGFLIYTNLIYINLIYMKDKTDKLKSLQRRV